MAQKKTTTAKKTKDEKDEEFFRYMEKYADESAQRIENIDRALKQEDDTGTILRFGAEFDYQLRIHLNAVLYRAKAMNWRRLRSMEQRIMLCESLGLIIPQMATALRCFVSIRNDIVHELHQSLKKSDVDKLRPLLPTSAKQRSTEFPVDVVEGLKLKPFQIEWRRLLWGLRLDLSYNASLIHFYGAPPNILETINARVSPMLKIKPAADALRQELRPSGNFQHQGDYDDDRNAFD